MSELLFGEEVIPIRRRGRFQLVRSVKDSEEGWVALDAISKDVPAPTHVVDWHFAIAHSSSDIKRAPHIVLPMGAQVRIMEQREPLWLADGLGWIDHRALQQNQSLDWVATARGFVGSPYLWGGRTRAGIDCSGLVQIALQRAGLQPPRNTTKQIDWGGFRPVECGPSDASRGDFIYMPGHVVIASGEGMCVHACGQTGRVLEEPLAIALANRNNPVHSVRRIQEMPA